MKAIRGRIVGLISAILDIVLAAVTLPAAVLLWVVRRIGLQRLPLSRRVLIGVGVLPVRRHYYEPFVIRDEVENPALPRSLAGIDWNLQGQRELLATLRFEQELLPGAHKIQDPSGAPFSFQNESFTSGDAEYLYQLIRRMRPSRVIEIGSGLSTILVSAAIERNGIDEPGYRCVHTCIEPFESPWLESMRVRLMRQRVETVDPRLFAELADGDLLFIDSSHVIRPGGDVLFEYQRILPSLARGVIVHIHDIFTPRDYPEQWIFDKRLLWNEQYLLEAFLTSNPDWQIIGALNLLKHEQFNELQRVCPYITSDREPGSFYIRKIR